MKKNFMTQGPPDLSETEALLWNKGYNAHDYLLSNPFSGMKYRTPERKKLSTEELADLYWNTEIRNWDNATLPWNPSSNPAV